MIREKKCKKIPGGLWKQKEKLQDWNWGGEILQGFYTLLPFCSRWPHPIPDLQRCKLFVYKRERRLATVLMGGGHIVSCDYWKPYPTAKTSRSFYCGYTKSSNNSTLFCVFFFVVGGGGCGVCVCFVLELSFRMAFLRSIHSWFDCYSNILHHSL